MGNPPGFAHFVPLRPPPRRGRHLWRGGAGSTVSLEMAQNASAMGAAQSASAQALALAQAHWKL